MFVLRLFLATIGSYILMSLLSVFLVFILPFTKAESLILSSLLSILIWVILIIYSFSPVKTKDLLIQFSVLSVLLFTINYYLV